MIRRELSKLVAAAGMCLFVMGCTNTEEGAKKDISNANVSISKGEGARVAKNVVAAVEVTPRVKSAITADKTLGSEGNLIDVSSADGVVHLTGHVKTEQMKALAEKVAQKTLDDNHSTDKVSNELQIAPK